MTAAEALLRSIRTTQDSSLGYVFHTIEEQAKKGNRCAEILSDSVISEYLKHLGYKIISEKKSDDEQPVYTTKIEW